MIEIVPAGQQMFWYWPAAPVSGMPVTRGFGQHVFLPFQEAQREVLCEQHLVPQHPNSAQHVVPQQKGFAFGQHLRPTSEASMVVSSSM